MLISYTLLQNYNLFPNRPFFFRRHSGIRSDIRLEEIAFSDIQSDTEYPMLHSVRIFDIRYPISNNYKQSYVTKISAYFDKTK